MSFKKATKIIRNVQNNDTNRSRYIAICDDPLESFCVDLSSLAKRKRFAATNNLSLEELDEAEKG